jgi:hypothetical protein
LIKAICPGGCTGSVCTCGPTTRFDWDVHGDDDEVFARVSVAQRVAEEVTVRGAHERERDYAAQLAEFDAEQRVLARSHHLSALLAHVDVRMLVLEQLLSHWHRTAAALAQQHVEMTSNMLDARARTVLGDGTAARKPKQPSTQGSGSGAVSVSGSRSASMALAASNSQLLLSAIAKQAQAHQQQQQQQQGHSRSQSVSAAADAATASTELIRGGGGGLRLQRGPYRVPTRADSDPQSKTTTLPSGLASKRGGGDGDGDGDGKSKTLTLPVIRRPAARGRVSADTEGDSHPRTALLRRLQTSSQQQ